MDTRGERAGSYHKARDFAQGKRGGDGRGCRKRCSVIDRPRRHFLVGEAARRVIPEPYRRLLGSIRKTGPRQLSVQPAGVT